MGLTYTAGGITAIVAVIGLRGFKQVFGAFCILIYR